MSPIIIALTYVATAAESSRSTAIASVQNAPTDGTSFSYISINTPAPAPALHMSPDYQLTTPAAVLVSSATTHSGGSAKGRSDVESPALVAESCGGIVMTSNNAERDVIVAGAIKNIREFADPES